MRNKLLIIMPVILMTIILISGCEVIGGIFKAGVWVGTLGIIFILAIIIFIVAKVFSKKKNV